MSGKTPPSSPPAGIHGSTKIAPEPEPEKPKAVHMPNRATSFIGLANHGKELFYDMAQAEKEVQASLTKSTRFFFMGSDAVCIYGLKDWSAAEWAHSLRTYGSGGFVEAFLTDKTPIEDEGKLNIELAATMIHDRCAGLMRNDEWQLVVKYQNSVGLSKSGVARQDSNRVAGSAQEESYFHPGLLSNMMFNRDFPLGVEDRVLDDPWPFAIENSMPGGREIRHKKSPMIDFCVYFWIFAIVVSAFAYLLYLMIAKKAYWSLTEGTIFDPADAESLVKLSTRTTGRGTVASVLQSLSFSLAVNALLDKFGKIDPSTSTVFIGMILGGTFGFMMDQMLGTDEGFREYRWSSYGGMKYAFGSLSTQRFARYIITLIFDMFFTVILFKLLYSRLSRVSGFSANGREWIANGFCSCFISVFTYQVYANMIRFEWAYPSGIEDVKNQWISGSTMMLAVVMMNMVYLTVETRTKFGEKGINAPRVKLVVTMITFYGLFALHRWKVVDPSVNPPPVTNNTVTADITNVHLPLKYVCETNQLFGRGVLIFLAIAVGSLGFVIFATSNQTLTGLKHIVGGPAPSARPTPRDRLLGKLFLFCIFGFLTLLIVAFFALVPFYSESTARNEAAWIGPCITNYDKVALAAMGLS